MYTYNIILCIFTQTTPADVIARRTRPVAGHDWPQPMDRFNNIQYNIEVPTYLYTLFYFFFYSISMYH